MKKLIVSGDSCTTLNFNSVSHPTWDFSWPKWPEHVAKHFDMKLVCLAQGGQGNEFIYSTLQDEILKTPKDEIGLVIAAWTQSHREDIQNGYNGWWTARRIHKSMDLLNCVRKSMRQFMSFQILCERFNLPYYHFIMCPLYESMLKEDMFIRLNQSEFQKKIDNIKETIGEYKDKVKNFLTYADQNEFTRFNMLDTVTIGKEGLLSDRIVSSLDDHPNEKGHKIIADEVLQRIKYEKINS